MHGNQLDYYENVFQIKHLIIYIYIFFFCICVCKCFLITKIVKIRVHMPWEAKAESIWWYAGIYSELWASNGETNEEPKDKIVYI